MALAQRADQGLRVQAVQAKRASPPRPLHSKLRPRNARVDAREVEPHAPLPVATKERLDRFTESHGLKKNFVVEQAPLYFMDARRELSVEALIPARLVLDDKAFDRLVDLLESPPAPTDALRELMRGKGR